jgi:hypothetical protein
MHGDAVAMPHGTQLFQRFGDLDGCLRKPGKLAQESATVAVDADVAQRRRAGQF